MKNKNTGFTIVELLIVVVIIAILAAITIVAYNGIQNRAKSSAAQSLANAVAKKAEAYNATESSYPANVAGFGTGAGSTGNPAEAKLDNASQVVDFAASASLSTLTDEKRVGYRSCTGPGAQIYYFNAQSNSRIAVGVGGAPSGTVTTACA